MSVREQDPDESGVPSKGRPVEHADSGAIWPIGVAKEVVRNTIIEMNRAGVFVCDRAYRIWDVDGAFLDMEGARCPLGVAWPTSSLHHRR